MLLYNSRPEKHGFWPLLYNGKLEKREVTLGEYNPMTDTQEVVEGLALEDYIAFPDAALCREGAPTTREEPVASEPEEMPMAEGEVS